jgi:hypothetical protein
VPGVPVPLPTAGYLPSSPCDDGDGGGRGGRGGGGNAGPFVTPGTYTVELVSGNTVLDSKPLRIVGDPAVRLADADRRKYDDIANDLHALQGRANAAQAALNELNREVIAAAPKVPANLKSDFDAFTRAFDAAKKKFGAGVAAPAAGRGGGGGRGGAPVDPANVAGRLAQARAAVGAFWEMPSASVMKQYTDAKAMLPAAIADANAVIARAAALSRSLQSAGVTLKVPDRVP